MLPQLTVALPDDSITLKSSRHGYFVVSMRVLSDIRLRHFDKDYDELVNYVAEYVGFGDFEYWGDLSYIGLLCVLGDGSAGV